MANRSIDTELWSDSKITDEFTAEDKYFWLFLLSTRYGNLSGIFEITPNQIARDMGYSKETAENLIYRFENQHKLISYDKDTKELFIYNWYKYNWTKSPLFEKSLFKYIDKIKNEEFKEIVSKMYLDYKSSNTVLIPYRYPTKSISRTNTNSISNSINDLKEVKEVIDYLNNKLGTKYRYNNTKTQAHIKARLKEGFTVEDFYKVIEIKYNEWHGTDHARYLRPETLFGTKFESYLNQKVVQKQEKEERYVKTTRI